VRQQITSIQKATNLAATTFSGIGATIAEINESATIVAAAIEEQSAASKEIASSAEKASTGTRGMANNVREIDQSVGQVDQAAQEVTTVTETLSRYSTENVHDLLKKMNVFMTELKKIA
jgi:methyl-accepting chemotaxis protein